jgi:Na+-driven multidrug efflux pump
VTLDLGPTELLAGVGVLLSLFMVWRAGARRAKAAAKAARSSAWLLSFGGRVLVTAGLIMGVQWLVLSQAAASGWLVLAVLGVPALFASYALTRALTVTTWDRSDRR